jgi:hypothetical protein
VSGQRELMDDAVPRLKRQLDDECARHAEDLRLVRALRAYVADAKALMLRVCYADGVGPELVVDARALLRRTPEDALDGRRSANRSRWYRARGPGRRGGVT